MHFTIPCSGTTDFHDLTHRIEAEIQRTGIQDGIASVFVHHTTAAIVIADDEAGLRQDFRRVLDQLIPPDGEYAHNSPGDANAHAHIRSMLCGASQSIPVADGALQLGTWQRVFLVDFDTRPRERTVTITIVKSAEESS